MTDHPVIYLEPGPGDYTGRQWCQDDVWTGDPDFREYGPPTLYIRADLTGDTMTLSDPKLALCFEYARLECRARELPHYGSIFRDSAWHLYGLAPDEVQPHLDAIKKVFEIDREIQNVTMVLMRASLVDADTTLTPRPAA